MATVVDGFSRTVVNWAIGENMESADLQILLQQAAEKFPTAKPRIISDNGPQFIANDFKAFVKIAGMTHVRTSPFYPQSNGKIERYHRTLKSRCIRPATPLDMLEGRQKSILEERDRKLEEARQLRGEKRRQEKLEMPKKLPATPRVSDVDCPVRQEDRATLGSAPSA